MNHKNYIKQPYSVMRNLLLIVLVIGVSACEVSEDDTKNKIIGHKESIAKLEAEIIELQKTLNVDEVSQESTIPVNTTILATESFNHFIQVNGVLEAVNDAMVSPEMNGQVKRIHVVEGDRVNRGDLLITLNTAVTESGIKELENGLELAAKIFEKQEALWKQSIGSEIQYLEAKNTKESLEQKLVTLEAQLAMSEVRAPFSGIVDEIFVKKGEMASPGYGIIHLINLKDMKIVADVSEAYLSQIRTGDKVTVSFPAYPEMEMELPVARIGNSVNKENRSFKIEMRLKNADNRLKPNILALLNINDFSADEALVIPSIIVKQDIQGDFLYVINKEEGHKIARKTYVEMGISYKAKNMINSGLSIGDEIVVDGYNMVANGSKVKVMN